MYITLSSKDSNNHARFTNKLLDNLVIEPNSKICLVSASLNQDNVTQRVFVPANQKFSFRYDPFNVFSVTLTTIDRFYTKEEFIASMNALLDARPAYGMRCKLVLEPQPDDDEIAVNFYVPDDFDANVDFPTFVYGQSYYRSNAWRNVANTNNVTDFPAPEFTHSMSFHPSLPSIVGLFHQPNAGANPAVIPVVTTVGTNNAYDRGRCELLNDFSEKVFDIFGVVNAPYSAAGERATDMWQICWGEIAYDDGPSEYVQVPVPGYGTPTPLYERIQLKGDYTFTYSILNDDTNAMETIVVTTPTYEPGDYFRHYIQKAEYGAGTVPNTNKLYTPNVQRAGFNALVYWAPLSINSGVFPNVDRVYNTLRLNHEPQTGFFQKQMDDRLIGAEFETYIGVGTAVESAINRVCGVCSAYGSTATDQYNETQTRRPLFMADKNIIIDRTTTQPNPAMNDFPIFFRRDPTDGPGAGQTLRGRLRLSEFPIVNKCSTMISIFFKILDDSGYNTDATRTTYTICGGSDNLGQSPVIQISPNQALAHDVSVRALDGSTTNLILQDGGATRINITTAHWYHLMVQQTSGDNVLLVRCGEYDAGLTTITEYSQTGFQNVPIANVQYIGGCDASLTTADSYYTGILGEFRMYHKPLAAVQASFQQYFESLGRWAFGNFQHALTLLTMIPTTHEVFSNTDPKYAHIGGADAGTGNQDNSTYGPVLANFPFTAGMGQRNPNYPEIVDFYAVPANMMEMSQRATGPNSLSLVGSYLESGSGLVQLNDINQSLEFADAGGRDEYFEPFTWYLPGADSPYFETLAEVVQQIIKDHGLRICIDNLPQRTFNGLTGNVSKCIYQVIGKGIFENPDEDLQQISITVPQKIYHKLNNAGELVVNSFDVVIRDLNEVEETNIKPDSNIVIEILGPNEM